MNAGYGHSGKFDCDGGRQGTNEVPPGSRLIEYCFGHDSRIYRTASVGSEGLFTSKAIL
jgi:hypothetical protein